MGIQMKKIADYLGLNKSSISMVMRKVRDKKEIIEASDDIIRLN